MADETTKTNGLNIQTIGAYNDLKEIKNHLQEAERRIIAMLKDVHSNKAYESAVACCISFTWFGDKQRELQKTISAILDAMNKLEGGR